MTVTAIRCDFCSLTQNVEKIPRLWGTLFAGIKISGLSRKETQTEEYRERKDLFRSKIPTQHICPKCLGGIESGSINIKGLSADILKQ